MQPRGDPQHPPGGATGQQGPQSGPGPGGLPIAVAGSPWLCSGLLPLPQLVPAVPVPALGAGGALGHPPYPWDRDPWFAPSSASQFPSL